MSFIKSEKLRDELRTVDARLLKAQRELAAMSQRYTLSDRKRIQRDYAEAVRAKRALERAAIERKKRAREARIARAKQLFAEKVAFLISQRTAQYAKLESLSLEERNELAVLLQSVGMEMPDVPEGSVGAAAQQQQHQHHHHSTHNNNNNNNKSTAADTEQLKTKKKTTTAAVLAAARRASTKRQELRQSGKLPPRTTSTSAEAKAAVAPPVAYVRPGRVLWAILRDSVLCPDDDDDDDDDPDDDDHDDEEEAYSEDEADEGSRSKRNMLFPRGPRRRVPMPRLRRIEYTPHDMLLMASSDQAATDSIRRCGLPKGVSRATKGFVAGKFTVAISDVRSATKGTRTVRWRLDPPHDAKRRLDNDPRSLQDHLSRVPDAHGSAVANEFSDSRYRFDPMTNTNPCFGGGTVKMQLSFVHEHTAASLRLCTRVAFADIVPPALLHGLPSDDLFVRFAATQERLLREAREQEQAAAMLRPKLGSSGGTDADYDDFAASRKPFRDALSAAGDSHSSVLMAPLTIPVLTASSSTSRAERARRRREQLQLPTAKKFVRVFERFNSISSMQDRRHKQSLLHY
jgi:hypothetical protein